jgi:cytoskeletal protein CcmA (bactofilin family)
MADKEPCLIGSKITIRGQVSGNQDLIVEGRIEGRVSLENRLTVEESGSIEADLEVVDASFKGEVRGDVTASRSAVLHPTARVVGNIRAPRLVIEEGARFSGSVEMDVELPAGVRSPSA